ncbi:protein NRT1/ PTR FAMILY 7.3-like [Iris pallida]|uniref:Protein NRT1/ PTR FAMILY 7.3-like n=1 Tax=Iris pallida TaxID=29817 RepID=A0AAX6EPF5_IRIPA|nr:protein NRT1/ PTR FAMILY 7.3-like [Iris pallida]
MWALGFWASAGSAFLALVLFLVGTPRYRHFKPRGNPLSRVCQVISAALKKSTVQVAPPDGGCWVLYEEDGKEEASVGGRKILHTESFKFLDRAALIDHNDEVELQAQPSLRDPWRLCTVTQVEELKCLLRLLPIWLCTILYSVVFTQMASLFVEQGSVMRTSVASFHVPPASMSAFDILSVAASSSSTAASSSPSSAGSGRTAPGASPSSSAWGLAWSSRSSRWSPQGRSRSTGCSTCAGAAAAATRPAP